MIDDVAAEAARATSAELGPQYGPRLEAEVEAAIYANGADPAEERKADQYFDPVALGALIVSITQFGYQVYKDQKKKGHRSTRDDIAQAIRIERRKRTDLTGEEIELIDIVSAKIIERATPIHGAETRTISHGPDCS
jgi:hypothetical protein